MSQTYADIIIDISHSAIDRVFQYRIGDAWKEQVQVGSLVTVPFGKGNAHRHGYVIGITQTPSYEPDKIKEIVDVPQKGLPIEGKLIQLAAWMRETYRLEYSAILVRSLNLFPAGANSYSFFCTPNAEIQLSKFCILL